MNQIEAKEIAERIRSAWPAGYMNDGMVVHWAEFLSQYEVDEAVKALTIMQRKSEKLPSQGAFADIIEGEAAHRVKCPHCNIGFRSEARVAEHIENIHYDVAVPR